MDNLKKIPLRDRKYAKTKLDIMKAFLLRAKEKSLDEISIKDVCDDVQISEGTFYNYFPKKSVLFIYFIQVWGLGSSWQAHQAFTKFDSIKAINAFFAAVSASMKSNCSLMYEIMAHNSRRKGAFVLPQLTLAEKILAYPDLDGIEEVNAKPAFVLFKEFLNSGVKRGELSQDIDIELATTQLMSIFLGTPLYVGSKNIADLSDIYQKQLDVFWEFWLKK